MQKLILSCLVLVASVASAQIPERDPRLMAEQVMYLVNDHIDRLPREDQRTVRQGLREIIRLFELNGHYPDAPTPVPMPPPRPHRRLTCDSSDNRLIDLDSGALVWDFNNLQNCQEAMGYVQYNEPFCDYQDNTLRQPTGKLIWDLNNAQNCKEAREDVLNVRPFCDYQDNTLRRPDGTLIHDFNNAEDCRRAKAQY